MKRTLADADEGTLISTLRECMAASRYADARPIAEAAVSLFPESSSLSALLGQVCQKLGDFPAAVSACDNAIALGCREWAAPFVLGLSHRALQDHRKAALAFMSAYERSPGHVEGLGLLLEEIVAAYGLASGRDVYQTVTDPALKAAVTPLWTNLLFRWGCEDELRALGIDGREAVLMSVAEWTASQGVALDYLDEAERIRCEEPESLEPGAAEPLKVVVEGQRPYACIIENATILSRSDLILTPDGAALNDCLTHPRFGQYVLWHQESAIKGRDGQRLLLDMAPYTVQEIEAGIMLSGAASVEFGHWMPEFLCRLRALSRHPEFASMPIIIDAGMPPSHYEYLRRVVSNEWVVLQPGVALSCKRLLIAPTPSFYPMHLVPGHPVPGYEQGPFSPACFSFLRNRVLATLPQVARGSRRLFLSRRKRQWRLILNDNEVAACLQARGFETIYPEDLSLEEQIRLFQEAEAIVGPNGSSWLNLMFADTAVKIVVLGQAGFSGQDLFGFSGFVGPMRTLGYDPMFVGGDEGDVQNKHINYSVPLDALERMLDRLGV
ncbi:glycosyltransferase family 61 protein [Pseudomonas sp. RC10]|uniref:glycosyltransferase family 61 protein n=1 Tax=Pseudomonas bambusae TaxID=3139142 RepID=UPI003138886F